jgi:hypothetical protein
MPMPAGEENKEAGLKRKKKRLLHEKVEVCPSSKALEYA